MTLEGLRILGRTTITLPAYDIKSTLCGTFTSITNLKAEVRNCRYVEKSFCPIKYLLLKQVVGSRCETKMKKYLKFNVLRFASQIGTIGCLQ